MDLRWLDLWKSQTNERLRKAANSLVLLRTSLETTKKLNGRIITAEMFSLLATVVTEGICWGTNQRCRGLAPVC